VAALAITLFGGRREHAAVHPEPRPGITAATVMAAGAVPRTVGSVEAYAAARAVPHVIDGLYCHCDCAHHSGHRSLLTCFESDHGAFCDICMGQAMLAQEMDGEGRSLLEIRDAIDRQFGS
jgi:hypothetical protein